MSWSTLPPSVRERAQLTLTPKQLEAWKLHSLGYGYRRVGRILGISTWSARDRIERAQTIIDRALKEAA